MVAIVKIDAKRVIKWFRRMPSKMEDRTVDELKNWGQSLVKALLISARNKRIKPFRSSRGLYSATRWEQNKRSGRVMMPMSGIYQDRAKAHRVYATKRNPMLLAWVNRYNAPRSFLFRPRPFINRPLQSHIRRAPRSARNAIRMAIAEAKV